MGLQLSPVVAGLWRLADWNFDTPALVRWIEQAIGLGITSFDHADIYGGYAVEAAFGKALASAPGLRERLQIVTKCGIKLVSPARPAHACKSYDSSPAHVVASLRPSFINFVMHQFLLQGREEALGRSVVPAVPTTAHAAFDPVMVMSVKKGTSVSE